MTKKSKPDAQALAFLIWDELSRNGQMLDQPSGLPKDLDALPVDNLWQQHYTAQTL